MITGLDHVVVLVRDIDAASASYQTLFARAPAWQNSGDGADRVLFTLDNTTLELISSFTSSSGSLAVAVTVKETFVAVAVPPLTLPNEIR